MTPSPSTMSETPAPSTPTPAVQRSRWASLILCAALLLLGLAWELVIAPTGRGTLAIKVLPLALALPALARKRPYTHPWLGPAVGL